MDAGRAAGEQLLAQLGGDLDADRPDRAPGRPSTACSRSVTAVGSAIPVSSAIRWICLMFVTGMMPGRIGMSQPSAVDAVDQPEVVVGAEEHLGDRVVRAGRGLRREHPGVGLEVGSPPGACPGTPPRRRRSRRATGPARPARPRGSCPSGCATHGWVGPPGGSPRSASTLRTPAPAYAPITDRNSSREWATQVRWPSGVSEVSCATRSVTRIVPSRVRAAGAVRDRDEGRPELLDLADRPPEHLLGLGRLRREELEREGTVAGRQQLTDRRRTAGARRGETVDHADKATGAWATAAPTDYPPRRVCRCRHPGRDPAAL